MPLFGLLGDVGAARRSVGSARAGGTASDGGSQELREVEAHGVADRLGNLWLMVRAASPASAVSLPEPYMVIESTFSSGLASPALRGETILQTHRYMSR